MTPEFSSVVMLTGTTTEAEVNARTCLQENVRCTTEIQNDKKNRLFKSRIPPPVLASFNFHLVKFSEGHLLFKSRIPLSILSRIPPILIECIPIPAKIFSSRVPPRFFCPILHPAKPMLDPYKSPSYQVLGFPKDMPALWAWWWA